MGVTVGEDVPERLHRLMGELLKWNAKVNLTAITAPGEVVEKHFLDSLAVLPEVEGAGSVLDVGAGAGFPGLPLKMARPALAVTMVDAVGKKVGYLKAVIAVAGLGLTGTKAVHTRAEGKPEADGAAASGPGDCASLHGSAGLVGPGAGVPGGGRARGGDAGQGAGG